MDTGVQWYCIHFSRHTCTCTFTCTACCNKNFTFTCNKMYNVQVNLLSGAVKCSTETEKEMVGVGRVMQEKQEV